MGTPNITGQYVGSFDIAVRSSDPAVFGQLQAFSGPQDTSVSPPVPDGIGEVPWTFNFSSSPKTVTLTDGSLTAQPGLPAAWFNYEARATFAGSTALPLVDNLDGTYTVTYHWQVFPLGGTTPIAPAANTNITLEITQLTDNSIAVVTMPGTNGIPGTPLPSPFPLGATPDWRGRAEQV